MRSSGTSIRSARHRARLAALWVGAGAALAGCADFTVVAATPVPTAATLALPPIGYNHRYGNNPVAAHDGFAFERLLFTQKAYWEVALQSNPVKAGYVQLGDAKAVSAARHATTDLTLVIATEDIHTITGLLATGTDAAQQQYVVSLVDHVRALGYDDLQTVKVLVFFTESDEHSVLTWTAGGGYTYKVNDGDLRGTQITPAPSQTPLPAPDAP